MHARGIACAAAAIALLAAAQPVVAASIQCELARGSVEHAICSDPRVLALDTQLSSVYAALLLRDPAQVAAIREDERDWLGERNAATHQLARIYRRRITFTRNVGDPDDTFRSPVVRTVLNAARRLPPGTANVLAQLNTTGVAELAARHAYFGLNKTIAARPDPPDAGLDDALRRLAVKYAGDEPYYSQTYLVMMYLPSAGIGGVYRTEGTASCTDWVFFATRGKITTRIRTPGPYLDGACGDPEYLASIDGYPILIAEHDGIGSTYADLQWQRWGIQQWDVPVRVRIRFARRLATRGRPTCQADVVPCEMVSAAALHAASTYLDDAWALRHPGTLNGVKAARVTALIAAARRGEDLDYGNAVWFPARIDGQWFAGAINQNHIGSHELRGLEVRYFVQRAGKITRIAQDYVNVRNGRVLLAARIPPMSAPIAN